MKPNGYAQDVVDGRHSRSGGTGGHPDIVNLPREKMADLPNITRLKLDLGCGKSKRAGFVGVDCHPLPGVNIVHNLAQLPWPLATNCAEQIILDNVIEHLPDTVAVFNELHRIAAPGCRVEISYPYWRSFGAYGDPTHLHYFNEFMIDYFLRPGTTGRIENNFAFYTTKYWQLESRELITYPSLRRLPQWLLRNTSRHFLDVIHGVKIIIIPEK